MGNPSGFMKVERALPHDRDATSRLSDWQEVHEHMETAEIEEQASRCMDCGVPFCLSAKSEYA
ncbi:MAG: glutamate synthase (NADPH/NADH) small chain, partial [Arenicella sp.]